jgi:hypothetical protein
MYMVKAQMQDHGTNYGQVQWAVSEHVPLMIKPGGMSLYSTVGKGGIVIDLSWLSSVSYNTERQEATLKGAVSSKTVAVELAIRNCVLLAFNRTMQSFYLSLLIFGMSLRLLVRMH